MLEGQSSRLVCLKCGAVDRIENVAPGSPAKELLLWILLVPGPFYSWWRWRNSYKICAVCRQASLLPEDAPLVRQTLPDLAISRTSKTGWETARDTLFALVIGSGVSIVLAITIALLFPSVGQTRWFGWLVMAPIIVITAHPLIGVLHVVLHLIRPRKQR